MLSIYTDIMFYVGSIAETHYHRHQQPICPIPYICENFYEQGCPFFHMLVVHVILLYIYKYYTLMLKINFIKLIIN